MNNLKLTYYYSACVGISSKDTSILCDPWFTDGIYDGSWYQYPKIDNPVKLIGKYHFIYISHIHGDHYDPDFLREYLKAYPNTKILIADFQFNYLEKKMLADGFKPIVTKNLNELNTSFHLLPSGYGRSDIDSALIVKYGNHAIVNMNDCPYSKSQLDEIKRLAPNPKIALLGYSGAGPNPQKYFDLETEKEELIEAAKEKKEAVFKRYKKFADYIGAEKNLPFAGIYILGGDNAHLNRYRGVSDAVEVKKIDNKAFVLETGGYINTSDLENPVNERFIKYDEDQIEAYAKTYCNKLPDYKLIFRDLKFSQVPWERLFIKCYMNAHIKSESEKDHYIAIKYGKKYFTFNTNKNKKPEFNIGDEHPLEFIKGGYPLYEIYGVDYKYLFGLLTGIFHWNNAEVGSHLQAKRYPNVFNRDVHNFLNFFQVI